MKYSIIFFSSWASLAAAAPLDGRQAMVKLPFIEPAGLGIDCGFRNYDEKTCGTDWYCNSQDQLPNGRRYKNSKECFDAHEPREPSKLPFIEPVGLRIGCGFRNYDEKTCGTDWYCNFQDQLRNGRRYKNSKECFDAHEPREPSKLPVEMSQTHTTPEDALLADHEASQPSDAPASAKKPWVYNDDDFGCRMDSEYCLGTEFYCLTRPQGKAETQKCFAEHEKPKLPFLAPANQDCEFDQTEACLGTEGYCAMLEKAIEASATECVARREPKP